MSNIFRISFKKSVKDVYLLFWSIVMPLAVFLGLAYFDVGVSDSLAFGIIIISIFFYCCTTNAFSILAQRKRGVFDLLRITPFSLFKYLSSITLSQTIIASVVSLILLMVGNVLFEIHLSMIQILLFLPLFVIASEIFALLGFSLSAIPKTEGQLSITTNLVMIPLLLCSNIFFDVHHAPAIVRGLSWINPVEWLQRGFCGILNNNVIAYLVAIVVLLVFLSLFLFLSKKSFQVKES